MAGHDGEQDYRRNGDRQEGDESGEDCRDKEDTVLKEKETTEQTRLLDLSFVHRSRLLKLRLASHTTILELGHQLVSASGVAPHTLRLLLPRAPALLPFSSQHSSLSILQAGISEDRVVRMMGALPGEINEVSEEAGKAMERTIIGFSEEDKRAKRWKTGKSGVPRGLPQGNYIFCDFQTLQLPGVELNPPASRALDIMHKLASDPGIVAIMNKHHWRVGVMTEMAPVGYVGISPKCILGYNKNQGEEISLRLRTDDLKGFRKYESIKKTLLHELAHMVHSEHDAHFHALNKQLNEEAMSLDWTKSGGQSVGGSTSGYGDEEEDDLTDAGGVFTGGGQKLGGSKEHSQLGARSAAALAALLRLSNDNERNQIESVTTEEINVIAEGNKLGNSSQFDLASKQGSDPDNRDSKDEPNPADRVSKEGPDPDNPQAMDVDEPKTESHVELLHTVKDLMPGSFSQMGNGELEQEEKMWISSVCEGCVPSERDSGLSGSALNITSEISCDVKEAGGVTPLLMGASQHDSAIEISEKEAEGNIAVSLEDDPSLKSLQEGTHKVCQKLENAIVKLKAEASPSEAGAAIQSLYKILRNLMDHPDEEKYKRLRKANVAFQNRIARFEGAIEILQAVGFSDEPGTKSGADYFILKRNDPVLLWLAQSSLEACMA